MENIMSSPILSRALDWLYPPSCSLCQTPLRSGKHLCLPCIDLLRQIPTNHCQRCGQVFDGDIAPPSQCPDCVAMIPSFDFATAALAASEQTIELIHQFKLRGHPELSRDLATLAAHSFQANPRLTNLLDPLFIPVPLHGSRLRSRRFNQAQLLSTHLSRALSIPELNALKRIRPTERQATLNRKQRLKNLKKAFQLRVPPEALAGKTLILVDDVFTTGSTAQECSKILRKTKPHKIIIFTIIRA